MNNLEKYSHKLYRIDKNPICEGIKGIPDSQKCYSSHALWDYLVWYISIFRLIICICLTSTPAARPSNWNNTHQRFFAFVTNIYWNLLYPLESSSYHSPLLENWMDNSLFLPPSFFGRSYNGFILHKFFFVHPLPSSSVPPPVSLFFPAWNLACSSSHFPLCSSLFALPSSLVPLHVSIFTRPSLCASLSFRVPLFARPSSYVPLCACLFASHSLRVPFPASLFVVLLTLLTQTNPHIHMLSHENNLTVVWNLERVMSSGT